MGIEPTLAAWEAAVLPLNYTRGCNIALRRKSKRRIAGDATRAVAARAYRTAASADQNLLPTLRKKVASLPPFWPTVTLAPALASRPSSLLRTPNTIVP